MRIQTNDNVIVIAGKDRGKKGKVIQSFPRSNLVVVENVNKVTKHVRSQRRDKQGQKVEFFGPIKSSNVKLVCPNCSRSTRVGYSGVGSKKKRICKKCKETLK